MTDSNSVIARRMASQYWGDVQYQKKRLKGVWQFDTAGHGGYIVDVAEHKELAEFAATVYIRRNSNYYNPEEQHFAAFEEDCMAAIVEWTLPQIVTEKFREQFVASDLPFDLWKERRFRILRQSLEQWNPDWLLKYPEPGRAAVRQ